MDHQIFVSYKRVNKDKVFPIKEYLEKETGLKFWIDLNGIESDAQFSDVIIDAINYSEVFLFFYSKEFDNIKDYDRDWCIKELKFAYRKRKRIVLINIDGSELIDKIIFNFNFDDKQQVDAQNQSSLDHLIKDLNRWFKKDKDGCKPKEVIQGADLPKDFSKENVLDKTDDKESSETKTQAITSDATDESHKSLEKDLQNSLAFEFNDKKFFMVLSDDKSFYIGNINAKKNDLSWIKNNVIVSLGPGVLCTTALAITVSTPIALIFGGVYGTVKWLLGSGKKKKVVVDANLCQKLYESTGYKFRVPTIDQLKGVEPSERTSCIILSNEDNPDLFFEVSNDPDENQAQEGKDNNKGQGLSMKEIIKEFGDIFSNSSSSKNMKD